MASSFDGNDAATGWFTSWGTYNEIPSSYIVTPHGQGFAISAGVHPYYGQDIGSSFSLALYADISEVDPSEKARFLLVAGTQSTHVALLKTAANTVAVYQDKAQLGELAFSSEALASGYHLFVFGGDSTGSFLAVDGVKVASSTAVNDPASGFQVGSVYGNFDGWSGVDKGIGMKVDEVRGYERVLSDAEIAQLSGSLTFYARTAVPVQANSTVALALTTAELASGRVTFTSPNATEPTGVTWALSHAGTALEGIPTATFAAAEDGQSGTWTLAFTANAAYEAITLDVNGDGIPAAAKTAQPTEATAFGKSSDYSAISADGTYWQAAKVTGATNSPMIFGGLGYDDNGPIDRNLLLTVTGGDFNHIYGGHNADDWGNDRTRTLNGNTRVEMSGGTVNYLFGGNYMDGAARPEILGNIDVVVSGDAVVKGSIFGGSVTAHMHGSIVGSEAQPQQVTVKVKNVQTTTSASENLALKPGYIAGGDTYMNNASPTCTIYGDTAVVIALPAEAAGTFAKHLVGGSALLADGGGRVNPTLTVTGNSSVTIDAPNTVTFSQTVMGGPAFGGEGGSAKTNGDASVTLRGGTYTGAIYAGGSGTSAIVSGNATLTLAGGDFAAATIAPCGPGSTLSGTSTLSITGDVDLSSTALSPFSVITLAEGKTLTLAAGAEGAMTVPAGATLRLVLSEAQLKEDYTTAATIEGTLNFLKRNAEGAIVELSEADGTVNGKTFSAAVNAWQAADGESTGTWSDTARWSRNRAPTEGEAAKVVLNGDVTLTVDEAATLSMLSVSGTGTLTLAGEARLTISEQLSVTANGGLTASATTLAPVAAKVTEGATFTYENDAVTLPALTGNGTFVKTGTKTLTLSAANSYEPAITVSGGTLHFADYVEHTQAYRVTVKRGATAQVGDTSCGLTNSAASLKLEAGATLKLPNGNPTVGNSTVAASITVDSAATAEDPAIIQAGHNGNSSTISGAITSSGETAGALRFDWIGENKFTLAGNITNVHLINQDITGLTISGKVSGGGSVTVKGGEMTLSGKSDYTGATTVEANGKLILANELSFTEGTGTNPTYPIYIEQGGTVTLAQNASTYRSFRGAGDLVVTGTNAVLGIPGSASVEGGFAVTGNVAVNANAVLTVTSWTSNAVLSGASLQIAGEVKKGQYDFSLDVANGKSLSGTGTLSVPVVSFAAGAEIEASTDGAVTCTGTVTLPESGAVTVKATEFGAPVLKKSGLDVTKFALPTEAGEAGWKTEGLFTEQGGTLYLVAKPAFTPPTGGSAMSDATARAIAELAAANGNYGITTVEVQADRVPEAVELFTDVMSVDGATATIAYDFGVSDLTISQLSAAVDGGALTVGTRYALICATVSNKSDLAQNTADYAEGTTLTVLNNGSALTGVLEPTAAEVAALGLDTPATGSRWLAAPLGTLFPEEQKSGTIKLTVKASK